VYQMPNAGGCDDLSVLVERTVKMLLEQDEKTDGGSNSMRQDKERRVPTMRNTGSGFTMIEIIVVVVIIAIAAIMVVPMMSSAESVQIRSAANMIAGDLEYAKSMAISKGQSFSVVFDKTAESYKITNQDGGTIRHPVKKGFDYIVDFRSDSRLDKVDVAEVNFNGTNAVKFDCLGSPDNGGFILLDAGGINVKIEVEPVTGFISVEQL